MPILVGTLAVVIIFQGITLFNIQNQNKQIANRLNQPYSQLDPTEQTDPTASLGRHSVATHPANPFVQLLRMQQEMDRVMSVFQHAAAPFQAMRNASMADYAPRVDTEQTEDKIIYRFDIPGLEKNKIQAKVQNGILTIQGERKNETQKEDTIRGFYSNEVSYGSFSRSMPLPPYVDENSVEASYDQGVLTVTFDKIKEKETETAATQIAVS